ncbi:bridge-like lipid transfer protein family member 1 [Ylistrum balloti]|uniref:bridge-like lipid transfer protein family member 1 n=1 Tax=Ylistrum balloti TaxID=509963 RepID=UPI002905F0D4|nr:bridge-like lipid transfer protein family member 1 [Ylistrum balloti]
MIAKIEEFITMQFTSSKRVLSAFGPIPGSSKTRISERRKLMDEAESWDIRHHRHWQKALELVSGCRFSMLPTIIPKEGTILGGNMTLRGNNLSLACFHGINFKSKSWAIFTVDEPYIFFATEAQKTPEQAVHVVEDLTFYIGHELTAHTRSKNMATICKLSRGHSMPPTFTSVQQWFHYAFATSEVKGLDTFPEMSRESGDPQADPYKSARSRKAQEYNHDTEIIFAFPSLQMHLKTIHEQAETEPLPEDPKPQVDCSFVTEFEDHIFVAMDAEVILFLHDLVSMYIKEKDKGTYGSGPKSAKSPESEKKRITHPTTALKQDWREFECNTWHVEPTVRLLHWASKQIDPVGVDYVLQKLGFTHARVTIPKWMQRGLLDPMDKLTSFLVQNLILVLKEKPKEDEEED